MIRLLGRGAFLIIATLAAQAEALAAGRETAVVLYAAVGPELTAYEVDVEAASLVKRSSVTLPANVQEAWPHPSRRHLYVTWSSNPLGPGRHGVTAFRIAPGSGALQVHGPPVSLVSRSVFMSADIPGRNLVIAHNLPSGITVHRIAPDGTLGAVVPQPADLDFGVYAHNVRIDPSNRMAILVARGNGPTAMTPEDPGALKVFAYDDGVLANRASIAPGGGYDFQPRHLEFHPTRPFVYVTLERQNKLQVYRKLDGPTLGAGPLFTRETLSDSTLLARRDKNETGKDPNAVIVCASLSSCQGQDTSTIHMHPNGRFLYLANRATATTDFGGRQVFAGGENSIAVYSVNQETGEPTLIQNADTRGVHPRTFTIDPGGRILVVANLQEVLVRDEEEVRSLPASLSVFRIGDDGRLQFVRKYDQDTSGGQALFWAGMVKLRQLAVSTRASIALH